MTQYHHVRRAISISVFFFFYSHFIQTTGIMVTFGSYLPMCRTVTHSHSVCVRNDILRHTFISCNIVYSNPPLDFDGTRIVWSETEIHQNARNDINNRLFLLFIWFVDRSWVRVSNMMGRGTWAIPVFRLPKIFINHSDWSHEFNQTSDVWRREHIRTNDGQPVKGRKKQHPYHWHGTHTQTHTNPHYLCGAKPYTVYTLEWMFVWVCWGSWQSVAGKHTIYK